MHLSHFSHEHPLVFREQQSNGNERAHCAGCTEPVIGPAYCCTDCRFCLHKRCAELPRIITHPLHPQHTLTLLAESPYPYGIYRCDMCRRQRKGFVYHCSACEFDLDCYCAFEPRLTSNIVISGDKTSITAEASEQRNPISKADSLVDKIRKMKALEAYKPAPLRVIEGRKLYTHRVIEAHELDTNGGKKSKARRYEGKDIVKKLKIQRAEIRKSSDNIPSRCIFKIPFPKLGSQKPELVSIGPYHRDEEHQLDQYKHSFLEKLLLRTSNNRERNLSFYVEEFIALEKRARACYSRDLVMSSHDFVKMMLVDGCFTIELLRQFGGTEDDLCPKDPNPISIIMPWQIPLLVQDLLLLENQIPFFVLEKLFELSNNREGRPGVSLTTIALKFFDLAFPRSSDFISQFSHLKPNHLLDLFVKTIPPSNPWNISNLLRPTNRGKWNISHSFFKIVDLLIQMRISDLQNLIVESINLATTATNGKVTEIHPSEPSASSSPRKLKFIPKGAKHEQENQSFIELDKNIAELLQAGIAFMPSRSNSFLDFNFKGGMLEIPQVTINNLFSTILVNSAALENCSPYYITPRPVTNYIYFMSCLIKEANDVQFLRSKGIISGLSNNDKKVADLFNLLGTYVCSDLSDSHFWETIRAIQCYNGRSRKPTRQFLMETSLVLVICCAVTLLIICLFCLRYIPRKPAQFLAVYGSANFICILSLQRSWRHVLRNPVQLMVIISTFISTLVLLLLSYLG